jgi:hypothetical protein
METYVHCLKNKFKSIEESYSWKQSSKEPENDAPFFKQAENCPDFKQEEGMQISLDFDGEVTIEDFKEDNEVYEAAKSYGW